MQITYGVSQNLLGVLVFLNSENEDLNLQIINK